MRSKSSVHLERLYIDQYKARIKFIRSGLKTGKVFGRAASEGNMLKASKRDSIIRSSSAIFDGIIVFVYVNSCIDFSN